MSETHSGAAPTERPSVLAPPPRRSDPARQAPGQLTPRTRLALVLLGNAISLGALADALLRANGLGLNITLGIAVLAAVMVWLARTRDPELRLRDHWIAIPALLFAGVFAWRDAGGITAINLVLLVAALVIWSAAVRRGDSWDVRAAQVRDYAAALGANAISVVGGLAPVLMVDVEYSHVSKAVGGRRAVPFVRGLLIAAPLLIVFGALLASADPMFAHLMDGLVDVDLGQVLGHVVVAGVFAWLAGGYLRGALVGDAPAARPAAASAPGAAWSLGIIEVSVVLGSLCVLFLTFVLVQLRYFFGGAALVQASAGLTYAEYARRGFFELVFVAALSVPLLLGAHALLRRERPRDERIFRGLAWALLSMLHVVMLSAVRRMWLYQTEFGLTEPRLYASAFMGWLVLVFALFAATVLRGRPRHFAFSALVAAWGVGLALNAVNPHALIMRTNLDRLRDGKRFDPAYVRELGGDAVPVLLQELHASSGPERCQVILALRAYRRPFDVSGGEDFDHAWHLASDWRSWNLGRHRAARALAETPDVDRLIVDDALRASGCEVPARAR